jgi:hypothetical protein
VCRYLEPKTAQYKAEAFDVPPVFSEILTVAQQAKKLYSLSPLGFGATLDISTLKMGNRSSRVALLPVFAVPLNLS